MAEITTSDLYYFNIAREQAEMSTYSGSASVGCVLVYHHRIIGIGYNSDKTCPTQKYYNRYRKFNSRGHQTILHKAHAEIEAIRSVKYEVGQSVKWKDVAVYLYRKAPGLPNGKGMSRPCPSCLRALIDKGVRNIYYTTDSGYAYEKIDD